MNSTLQTRTGHEFLAVHTEWSRDGQLHYFAGLLGNGRVIKAYVQSWGVPSTERWVSVSLYTPIQSYFNNDYSTVCSTGTSREGWKGQYGLVASHRSLRLDVRERFAWTQIENALPGFRSLSLVPPCPMQGERLMRASDFLDLFAIQMTG